MKKITLLYALFAGVFCHPLFAQDDSLLVDSIEPEIGIAQMFDSCYKNLNLEYATTGLLIDKAIPTINVQAYSGQAEDTPYYLIILRGEEFMALNRPNSPNQIL